MNWILLFMILELLAITWAKPIDSTESNSELQTEKETLHMQTNLSFTLPDGAYDLNKRLDNSIIRSTEIVPNKLWQKPEEISKRSQYVTENSTEPIESLKGPFNSSNDNIFSTSTFRTKPSPSENSPNDSKIVLLNEDVDKNFTDIPTENDNDTNVEVKREAEDSLDITTHLNTMTAEPSTQQSENISEQTTVELITETNAGTTQATFEMLQEDVKYFYNNFQQNIESFTANATEELEKSDINAPAVDIPDSKDFTNLETYFKDLTIASTSEKTLTSPLSPVDIFNTVANESTESFLSSSSEKILTQEKTTGGDQKEDTNETTTLDQTVDWLTYQAGANAGHIGTLGDTVVTVSSVIQPITEDADTSAVLNKIRDDSENSTDPKFEAISEHIPTLKRVVDGFPAKQNESTSIEVDNEKLNQEGNFSFAKLNGTQETITATSSVLENLSENEEQETSSASTDFSTTNDNLIGTTLSNFEKSETELFSATENTPKAVTESSSESSPEKISHITSPKSTSRYSLENFPDVATNNLNEITTITQTSPESFSISTENVNRDEKKADNGKNLLFKSQANGTQQSTEATSSKNKTQSEVNNEDEASSTITTLATQFETVTVEDNMNGTETEVLESQATNKVSKVIEDTHESRTLQNPENALSHERLTPNVNSTTTNEITTENYSNSSQIAQETSTSGHFKTERTSHEFSKLENALIETEKLPSTTALPTASITLSVKITTVSPLDESKNSTEKLQEKLKEAVKVMADEMRKMAVRETEHGDLNETTTFKNAPSETSTELVTPLEPLSEHVTTINTAADETSTVIFVPDKSDDVTTQKFIGKLAEESKDSTTASQIQFQPTDFEHIKNSRAVFDTTLPPVKEINDFANDEMNVSEAATTIENDFKENLIATTTENFVPVESTNEDEIPTTEESDIAKTTNAATLARVSLLKDVNNISLNANVAPATEVSTQNIDTATANEIYIESTTIMQPTEPIEETIILTSSEASLLEHTNTSTFKKEEQEVTAQTQSTPTQPSFMEEQQQQVEITTEQVAQTASAATSGQTVTTINYEKQQTTEAEIYTTAEKELEEKTTSAAAEVEARSLPLSPAKLEHSQSEDGVEVFYGYSNVNHN